MFILLHKVTIEDGPEMASAKLTPIYLSKDKIYHIQQWQNTSTSCKINSAISYADKRQQTLECTEKYEDIICNLNNFVEVISENIKMSINIERIWSICGTTDNTCIITLVNNSQQITTNCNASSLIDKINIILKGQKNES